MKYCWVFFMAFFAWVLGPFVLYAQNIELTEAERVFLGEHSVIRVGFDSGWPPIEYADKDGTHRGVSADYLVLLSQRLGIRIKVVTGLTWVQIMDGAKSGDIDVLSCLKKTPERELFLNFTDPYFISPISIFMQQDKPKIAVLEDLENQRVAVVEGYAQQGILEQQYPKIKLVPVKSVEVGLRWVSSGDVDAYVEALATATYVIQEQGITNVKLALHTPYTYDLAMGVRKDWIELASILDKGLKTITQEERNEIYNRWVAVQSDVDQSETLKVVGWVLGGTALGLVFIFFWVRQIRRREARFKAVLESTPDGMLIVGAGGKITLVNEPLEEMFGYKREELLRQTIEMLVPERFHGGHKAHRDSYLHQPRSRSMGEGQDLYARRKDGSEFPVEISLNPIRSGDGQILAAVRDVTQRKIAELELRKLSNAVEQNPTAIFITDTKVWTVQSLSSHVI